MPVRGTLQSMSLADLFGWIERQKKTGVVQLQHGRLAKDFFVNHGKIVSSGSNDPREYLGEFFISFGKLTEEDLIKAYQIQKETKVYLGKILVMIDKVTEAQVQKVIVHKTRETALDCFLWEDGHFVFTDREEGFAGSQVEVALAIGEIVSEGVKRAEEWQSIRKLIPSSQARLKVCREKFPRGFPERADEKKLVEFIEAGKRIPDMCLEFHMGEFLVTKKIYQFVQQGLLAVVDGGAEKSAASSADAQTLLKQAETAYAAKDLSKALESLDLALEKAPEDEKVQERFQEVRKEVVANLKGSLKDDLVPQMLMDPAKIDLAGYDVQEGYVLSRVNGSWTVSEIAQICPFPQEKVLQALKRFASEKVISL